MHRYFLAVIFFLMFSNFSFAGRYYDARTGRFLQTDPHKENYASLSPYCYVGDNPLNRIDPNGKDIKMIYRTPDWDAGHIILQVVDHNSGKVLATWSFGPVSNAAAMTSLNVEGHQTSDINAYLKDNKALLKEATIGTSQATDKIVVNNIEERLKDNEDYNVLDNNCGQTAVQLINTSGVVQINTTSIRPSSVFQDFLNAKKKMEEQKKQEAQKKQEERKKKEQENQQETSGGN